MNHECSWVKVWLSLLCLVKYFYLPEILQQEAGECWLPPTMWLNSTLYLLCQSPAPSHPKTLSMWPHLQWSLSQLNPLLNYRAIKGQTAFFLLFFPLSSPYWVSPTVTTKEAIPTRLCVPWGQKSVLPPLSPCPKAQKRHLANPVDFLNLISCAQ